MKKITLSLLFFFLSFVTFSQGLPLEGFESTGGPDLPFPTTPSEWTLGTSVPGNTWQVFDNNVGLNQRWDVINGAGNFHAGANATFIDRENINAGNTSEDFLATPLVTIPANGQLKFWTRTGANGDANTIFQIKVAPATATQINPNAYSIVQQWSETTLHITAPSTTPTNFDLYIQKTVDLSTYAGQQVYLAFVRQFTQPTAAIGGDRWYIDDVQIIQQCFNPTALTASAITFNSANLAWTSPGVTSWQIEVLPAASTPTGVGVDYSGGLPYAATNLLPNTAYQYFVRSVCSLGNFSGWAGPFNFTTGIAPPGCGGNYADTGGTTGNYGNNEDNTITICPINATDVVTVTFNSFNTQATFDGLYVFNGNSITTPQISSGNLAGTVPGGLAGAYWGTANIGSFTSSAADGCLTFRFRSNATTVAAGWVANVTCAPAPVCPQPNSIVLGAVLSSSVTLSWTETGTATQWNVIALPCGSPAPNASTTAFTVANSNNNFVLNGLNGDTCYNIYVRAACTGGSFSNWSGPRTATTQITPPACGGVFTDLGGATANYPNNADSTVTICPTTLGDQVTVTFTAFNTEANWDGLYVFNGNSITATQIASANPAANVPGGLAGSFWGTTIPGPFTGESASGCLTFRFRSDGSVNNPGWVANVTCALAPTCPRPISVVASATTSVQTTLSWTSPGPATQWQVLALPCGSPAPTALSTGFVTANINTGFVLTGLIPDTCYNIYIRSICSSTDLSLWSTQPPIVQTQQIPPACGGTFSDLGGSAANYPNNADSTVTICPINLGDAVTVTFTSFNIQANNDGLYIFNGDTIGALQISSGNPAGTIPGGLAGAYWGTANIGAFTSSAANGCLTFRFRSNASVNAAGWVANVTCAPATNCPQPISIVTSAVLSSSITLSWTETGTASQWDVIALPCGAPAPNASTTGFVTATSNNNFVLTGLTGETCYDIYVRSACSASIFSTWSGPRTATTQITPPACGGTFTDLGGAAANYPNNADSTVTICPTTTGDQVTVTFTSFSTEANWDGLYVFNGNSITAPQIASANPAANVPGGLAGSFWGTAIPGPFTGEGSTGCLTFRFRSDGSVNRPGWVANVTCAQPPTCPRPINVTATLITQTSANIAWTEVGTATQWEILVLPAGSPIPIASTTGFITTNTSTGTVVGSLPSGTQFQVYVRARCSPTDPSLWSVPTTFATLITNDECANAIVVPVNPDTNCAQTVGGTVTGATASITAIAPCTGTPDDDVWFQFTATAASHYVSLQNVLGSNTDLYHAVYSGTCGSLVNISCSDANVSQINGLVIGQTYYIRVYTVTAVPNQNTTFTLCVGTPVQCADSAPFCGSTGLVYPSTVGSPGLGQIGCLFTTPNPAFFYLQVETSGPLTFQIAQTSTATGLGIDVDFIAYGPFTSIANACGNLNASTTVACSYSAAAIENFTLANAVIGQIYVVMITNFNGSAGTVTFSQMNNGTTGAGSTNCDIVCSVNLGSDQVLCDQTSYTITSTNENADSYQWFNGTTLIPGEISSTLIVTQTGTYVCKIVCGLNNAEDTINVTFNTSVASTFLPIASICQNSAAPTLPTTSIEGSAGTWMPAAIDTSIVGSSQYVFTPDTGICAQSATITITIDAPVDPQFAPVGPLCLNSSSVTLPTTSINGVNGTWLQPVVTAATVGTTDYIFTPAAGSCANTVTLSVTISDIPTVDTLPNVTSCNSYVLPTLVNGNYFTGINGTGTPLAVGATIPATQTIYIFAANPSNTNCTAQTSFVVTINSITAQQIADVTVCDSHVLPILNVNNAYYTGSNGTGSQLNAGTSIITTQTIYVYAQTGGTPNCTSESSFTVTITATPVLADFANVSACSSYILPTLTIGNYFTGINGTDTQLASGMAINSDQTVYVYASNGICSAQKQFVVTINDNPSFTIDGACQGTNFVLEALPSSVSVNVSDYTFSWTNSNGDVLGSNSTVTVGENGTYNVLITSNSSNCSVTEPYIANQTACSIQKGISPNNDGLNDGLDLTGYGVKKLSIFNRYGTKVYSKVNYINEWYGQTDSGKELPDGTYYYVIEKNDGENKSGWIYINRQN